MPWSTKPRKNFFMYAAEDQLEIVLTSVKHKLMEWSTTRAGQLAGINMSQPASSEIKDAKLKTTEDDQIVTENSVIKQSQPVAVTEETLQLQRERCLAKLLA